MIRTLYTLILLLGLVVLSPVFVYRGLRHKKYLGSLRERLGALKVSRSDRPTLWIHAVSVGELLAAEPLARFLISTLGGWHVVLSTTTATGQALARERFGTTDVFYFPLDLPWAVRRTLERVDPVVVCFVETEIWPNFLAECKRRKVRVCMVNGRISDSSFRGYSRVRRLLGSVLDAVELFLMQTDIDKDRITWLGAELSRVDVTGNLKYDVDPAEFEQRCAAVRPDLERSLALPDSRPLIVAGSTADGEEELLARALALVRTREGLQGTRMLIAPRRPERFAEVERICQAHALRCSRRSTPSRPVDADILLLDTIGELATAYSLGDVVFVGGSLVEHGGQNILEPAMAGRPIIVGPHTNNFRQIVDEFREAGAIVQLGVSGSEVTVEALADEFARLLLNQSAAEALANKGSGVIAANRGAVNRTIEALSPLFEASS